MEMFRNFMRHICRRNEIVDADSGLNYESEIE